MSQQVADRKRIEFDEESLLHQFAIGDKGTRKYFYPLVAILGLGVTIGWFVGGAYLITVLYLLYMYAALALFWNFFSGYSGYIMFGATIFFGVSAYGTAALVRHLEVHWVIGLLGGALLSIAIAAIAGYILLRISGIYFAVGTFLLMEGIVEVIYYENSVTGYLGGAAGIVVSTVSLEMSYFGFGALMLLGLVISYELGTSKFGMRLMAVRDDEEALAALGVNPLKYTLPAFVATAFFMSLIGSLYILSLGFVYPQTPFQVQLIVIIILATILGGSGTVWGPFVGIMFLYPLQEVLWESFPDAFLILYGIILIGVVILLPEGIMRKLVDLGYLPDKRFI